MKIVITGSGVMAHVLKDCIEKPDELVAMLDPKDEISIDKEFDVIIDFSNHKATRRVLDLALLHKKPILIATTGQTEEEMKIIYEAESKIKLVKMSNTSEGVNAVNKVVQDLALLLKDFDIEIVEKHHNRKIDAPSGTALAIANSIIKVRPELEVQTNREGKRKENEIGISSLRAGNIPGEHSVIFAGIDEIVEIKHTALSRKIFAIGAIKYAKKLIK